MKQPIPAEVFYFHILPNINHNKTMLNLKYASKYFYNLIPDCTFENAKSYWNLSDDIIRKLSTSNKTCWNNGLVLHTAKKCNCCLISNNTVIYYEFLTRICFDCFQKNTISSSSLSILEYNNKKFYDFTDVPYIQSELRLNVASKVYTEKYRICYYWKSDVINALKEQFNINNVSSFEQVLMSCFDKMNENIKIEQEKIKLEKDRLDLEKYLYNNKSKDEKMNIINVQWELLVSTYNKLLSSYTSRRPIDILSSLCLELQTRKKFFNRRNIYSFDELSENNKFPTRCYYNGKGEKNKWFQKLERET